ncbi:MAG: hypothetical protein AABX24_05670 [Nanoarchaeota archaeon]
MEVEEIEVGMGELKKAFYPNFLCSGGLGPCIAVAVYHPATRSGYMLHEHHADIEAKIKEIKRDYRDLSRVRVYVTGNSLFSDFDAEQKAFERSFRADVEKIISQYFNQRQTKIQWLADNHCGELYLYTSSGKFIVDSENLVELCDDSLSGEY